MWLMPLMRRHLVFIWVASLVTLANTGLAYIYYSLCSCFCTSVCMQIDLTTLSYKQGFFLKCKRKTCLFLVELFPSKCGLKQEYLYSDLVTCLGCQWTRQLIVGFLSSASGSDKSFVCPREIKSKGDKCLIQPIIFICETFVSRTDSN